MMLGGQMFILLARVVCFLWHAVKAGWPALSCLLGQNHGLACLLPKAGGDKGTEVLKHQSHVSAGTLRMEKDLQEVPQGALLWSLCCFFGKSGRRQPLGRCVRIQGRGQGSVGCFTFGSFNPRTTPLVVEGRDWTVCNQMVLHFPVLHEETPLEGGQDLASETCELLQPMKFTPPRWRVLGLFLSSVHAVSQAAKS